MSKGKMEKYYPQRIKRILNNETPIVKTGYTNTDSDIYIGEFIDREGNSYPKYETKEGKHVIKKDGVKIDVRVYENLNVRCPLFCPECNKAMNTKADEKMWALKGKCHKCVAREEQVIRVAGHWKLYEDIQMDRNRLSFLLSAEQEINDYLKNGLSKEISFINENGKIEKWDNDAFEKTKEFLNKELSDINENSTKIADRLKSNLEKWNETGLSKI